MARYLVYNERVYNQGDYTHKGPSISLVEFAQGQKPPAAQSPCPVVPVRTTKHVPSLVEVLTWMAKEHERQAPPPKGTAQRLVEYEQSNVPLPPNTLSEVLRIQREQGRRPSTS